MSEITEFGRITDPVTAKGRIVNQPLNLGWGKRQRESIVSTVNAAGVNQLNSTTVPAGQIWIVEIMGIIDTTAAPTKAQMGATFPGYVIPFVELPAGMAVLVWFLWNGAVTLQAGESLYATFTTPTANNNLIFRYAARVIELTP